MIDHEQLAARIEALDGPSREVDAEIYAWVRMSLYGSPEAYPAPSGKGRVVCWYKSGTHGTTIAPRYTASLDAAMSLVPEGASWEMRWFSGDKKSWITFFPPGDAEDDYFHIYNARTPALALCAAALRARRQNDG